MDYIRGGRVFNSLSKISSNDAGSPAAAGWSPGSAIPHTAWKRARRLLLGASCLHLSSVTDSCRDGVFISALSRRFHGGETAADAGLQAFCVITRAWASAAILLKT